MTSHTPEPSPAQPATRGARGAWRAALVCALAGAAVFQFFGNANHGYIDTSSLFYWWGYQWVNPSSETEHGWLILALSLWLFRRNLGEARRVESRETRVESGAINSESLGSGLSTLDSAWPAFIAMIGGLLLHALGFAVQQARVSILALLLFTWGVLVLFGGRRAGRAAALPLAFMVFAIPFNVLDTLGFWLRLGVTNTSAVLAHVVGVGVLQSGTQLLSPDGRYQYDVAAACSGVRSLMALAALSLLVGYLAFRPWWLRAAVLMLCLPFTYVGNVARILSIILAAQWGGQKWGDRAHDVMGYGVFVIVLGGVLLVVAGLRRVVPSVWLVRDDEPPGPARPAFSVVGALPAARGSVTVAALVAILAAVEIAALAQFSRQPLQGEAGVKLASNGRDPVDLPVFLGTDWIGRPQEVTAVEREILPQDTGFSRKLYVNPAQPERPVFCSIVLSGRDRTSIHRPELCLVGQGWTIAGAVTHNFAYPAEPQSAFPATLLRVRRETVARSGAPVPQLVAYWFVSSDAIVATSWRRFAHDAWNRVRHLRADRWAYVLMQTDARDGEAAALARMQAVLDRTLPAFQPPQGGAR